MSNEESIWVMDYKNQLIREKVMMEKPSNFDNYTNGFPEGAFFKSELKVFDEYKKHLASRRTFSYPVSKEQDGKEIKESEFRFQHQVQTMFNDVDEWTNCDEWTHDSMPIEEYRRIIAIPIEPERPDIQKHIDNGNIDTDPICKTELFLKLKSAIGGFMWQHLKMNESGTAIEANPATHRIAEYVYKLLDQRKFDEKDLIIYGLEEGAELWKSEYDNCRTILKTLVELKELKDKYGKTGLYNERQPLAWERAKEFLKTYQHGYE